MEVHLTLRESLLGFYKSFKHLDGHEVDIDRRDKTTKPGFTEKIKDEGMPKSDYSGDFGDLIVKYVVDYPEELTPEQTGLFK